MGTKESQALIPAQLVQDICCRRPFRKRERLPFHELPQVVQDDFILFGGRKTLRGGGLTVSARPCYTAVAASAGEFNLRG